MKRIKLRIAILYFLIFIVLLITTMFIVREAPVDGMKIKASSYIHYLTDSTQVDLDEDGVYESTHYVFTGTRFGMQVITLTGDNVAYYVGYDLKGDGEIDFSFTDDDGDGTLDFETWDIRTPLNAKLKLTGEELLQYIHDITIQGFCPTANG